MEYGYDYEEEPEYVQPPSLEVERRRRKIRRLYGPHGEVLRSFSNCPPVGFHQGSKGVSR